MVNYSNSIIYKLCCLDPSITDIYIGSTTSKYRRKNNHKSACNNPNDEKHNFYVDRFIRQHGGWDNWDFVEIEQYSARDKSDLHKRERHWIETLKSTLNKEIPGRTKTEYRSRIVQCDCGVSCSQHPKNEHYNSKKHKVLC